MNIGDVDSDTPEQASPEQQISDHEGLAESTSQTCGTFSSNEQNLANKDAEKAVEILNDLRCKGQLCDAVIRSGESSFYVHRNILSACSSFFKALFTSKGFQKGDFRHQPQEVELSDVTPEVLGYLIDYAYSRQMLITVDNVQTILHAADRFMMPSLAKACCDFLTDRLCEENCLGIAALARTYYRPGLEKAAMQFAYRNFHSVVAKSQEFLELSADSLHELLSSDLLNVRHEELVFQAICKWIQNNPASRKEEMPRMLRTVRLGFLSSKYLVEKLKPHELISSNAEARAVVINALKYVCNLKSNELNLMETLPSIHKPRVPHEILFVIGGWSGGSPTDVIETYDTRADQWLVCRPPGSELRAYHACVAIGQMIYVVGGFNGVEYFNSCRKFDPINIRWSEAPPMNSKRCYVSGAGLQGKVYAMGGFDGHVRLNTVERLNPATNQWSYIFPMIQQRSDAKASVLNDKIYICGGFNGQECLNTAESYDPVSNQWTMISPMRNRRSGVGVVAYCGYVYALGGFNGITRMNSAERYDPCTQLWTTIPEMCHPRSNFALGVIDDLLFVIGGFNGVTTISNVECFDETANEWFEASSLSLYRSALGACVVKDLPNIMDFVFQPMLPVFGKRNRPPPPLAETATDPDAAIHSSSLPAQDPDEARLNQLA